METWYEVSLVMRSGKNIHILDTQSLEAAEDKKLEFVNTGLKAAINVYDIINDVAYKVGEIK